MGSGSFCKDFGRAYFKNNVKQKYFQERTFMIMLHHSKEYLSKCMLDISEKLHEQGLELNEKKTKIYKVGKGIKFLGFKFILTNTGKVLMLISKESIKREKRKLKKLVKMCLFGRITRNDVDAHFNAYLANVKKSSIKSLAYKMIQYYRNLWRCCNAPN